MTFRPNFCAITTALLLGGSFYAYSADISGTITNGQNEPVTGAKITLLKPGVSGQIVGRIVDRSSGAGIAGAQVFIDVKPELGGQSPVIAISDSQGYYSLAGLAPNSYTVGVWLRGYETQYQMNIEVTVGQNSVQDLTIGAVTVDEEYLVILDGLGRNKTLK